MPKSSTQIKQSPRKSSRSSAQDNDPFAELTSPRKPSPQPVVQEPEEPEDYAPAATEMRKRLAANGSQNIVLSDSDTPSINTSKTKKGKKRPAPDDDEVVAAAKERKRAALDVSRQAAEELAEAVRDHAHLKNLGTVETFHVDFDARPSRREDRSGRWDAAWNGRKNFKKFRKAKQSVSVGVGREIIQLVDFKGRSAADSQGIYYSGEVDLEFFFAAPRRSRVASPLVASPDPSLDDFDLELTASTASRRGITSRKGKETQSTSSRSGRSTGRSAGRNLYVRSDDSDNSLDFDS
jgi:hypothetical protein